MRRYLPGLAVAAAVVWALTLLLWRDETSTAAGAVGPTVSTRLPDWRAPGVRVPIAGSATPGARVRLLAGGRVVATTTAGGDGRYRLGFTAGRPGSHRLAVAVGDRTHRVGTLLVRPALLRAVGDITFGEQVGPALARHGAAYAWRSVAPVLRAADVTVGNLETAVTTGGTAAAKEYTFRGPPRLLGPLAGLAGFDVLTLANNHSGDFGRAALLETVENVRAAGIRPVGAGADEHAARRPAIVEAGGLRIALLGYSDVNPDGFTATAREPGTARAEPAAIDADVRAAHRAADVVVCYFHWGTELRPEPDGRQQLLAGSCLNAGGSLVLGAHPHVLGGVARPSRSTLVAWTLGNFVFPSQGVTARTAVLDVELDRRGVRGHRLVPLRIDGFRPLPLASSAGA